MYMRWKDASSGDSLLYDITIENKTLAINTYTYDVLSFNGSVNFYIYHVGVLQAHDTFADWTTSTNDSEAYRTSSAGGYTTTRLAFIDAITSGNLKLVGGGATNYPFTSSYTICPKY